MVFERKNQYKPVLHSSKTKLQTLKISLLSPSYVQTNII